MIVLLPIEVALAQEPVVAPAAVEDAEELEDAAPEVETVAVESAAVPVSVVSARYLDLAWRREGGNVGFTVLDGLDQRIGLDRMAAERTNPLLVERLRQEEMAVRKKAENERWAGIGILAISPIPLLALVAMDGYRVREDSFDAAGRYNDLLIWGSAGTAALGATLVVDSFAWRPRLKKRRGGDPGGYLPVTEADAMVAMHNERVRRELAVPEAPAER